MKIALVSFALATVVQAAPVPKELRTDPLEQFRGKWVIVGLDDGEGMRLTGTEGAILHFDGDSLSIAPPGVKASNESMTFDARAKPIRMTLTTKTTAIRSLIKIENERLFWCQTLGDGTFPADFQGRVGYRCFLLKRVDK